MRHGHRVSITMKSGARFRGHIIYPDLPVTWKGQPVVVLNGWFRRHMLLVAEVASVTCRTFTDETQESR